MSACFNDPEGMGDGDDEGSQTSSDTDADTDSDTGETEGDTDEGTDTGTDTDTDGEPGCGNGIVEEGEACDDGNDDDDDACLSTCVVAECGDGFVHADVEDCDGEVGEHATCRGCVLECDLGFEDCNGVAADGCEVDPLITADHCGACGHDCLGGGCEVGLCQAAELAGDLLGPRGLAVDQGFVYYLDQTGGYLARVGKDVGNDPIHMAEGLSAPYRVAVDDDSIYFTELLGGRVSALSKGGGVPEPLLEGLQNPYDVVVDGDVLFVSAQGSGELLRYSLPDDISESLATGTALTNLAMDQDNLYFPDFTAGDVSRVAKQGGAIETLSQGHAAPFGIAVHADAAYYSEFGAGIVWQVESNGGEAVEIATDLTNPSSIAVDESGIYVAEEGAGRILRIALDNPDEVYVIAEQQGAIGELTTDDDAVYWTAQGPEALMKWAKE